MNPCFSTVLVYQTRARVCMPVPVRFINPILPGPEELHIPAISGHNTYDTSLSKTTVPMCLKVSTIVSVSKALTVSCVSEYHPVAFTPAMISTSRGR